MIVVAENGDIISDIIFIVDVVFADAKVLERLKHGLAEN